jgi:MFS family permease
MVALALAPNVPLAMLAAVPVGFSSANLISGSNAVMQVEADPNMRGRVLALLSTVFLGSTPIGGPIVGWISESFGARVGLGVGAVAVGLVTVWVARQLRHLPAASRRAQPIPEPSPAPAAAA